jgi:hypothetical protein
MQVDRLNWRRNSVVTLIAIMLLCAAVVFSPKGGEWLWSRRLHDLAHGPIFGCVAVLVLLSLRAGSPSSRRPIGKQYAIAFITAVALGALTEVAQFASRRDPSWWDVATDALGAAAFLLANAAFDSRVRAAVRRLVAWTSIGAAVLLLIPMISTAVAYLDRARSFPVIADITRGIGGDFWTTRLVETEIEDLPRTWSTTRERGMFIEFLPGRWQGLDSREPPVDWSGYATLVVDLINPTGHDLEVVLRIEDRAHDGRYADRYNGELNIPPQTRSVFRIPLADIEAAPRGRKFELSKVNRILLFRRDSSQASSMYLVGMRLE